MAFESPNYWRTNAYQSGHWDGQHRFYSKARRDFPTGMVPYVLQVLRPLGIPISLRDARDLPPRSAARLLSPARWGARLRRRSFRVHNVLCVLQWLALRAITKTTLRGFDWPRGLLQISVGGGKTVTAFWAIECWHGPALYVVPRQDLLLQAADDYERLYGYQPGLIGMSQWNPSEGCTLAMVQTLAPLARANLPETLEFLRSIRTIVVDEAHLVGDNGYLDILARCPHAGVRLAFGGSLLRRANDLGDWHLIGAFGRMLYRLPSKKLRDAGILAGVRVFLFRCAEPRVGKGYRAAEQAAIIQNEYRNKIGAIVALRAASRGWVTLVLVQKRVHGLRLQQVFRALGCAEEIPFLCYKDPAEIRKHYLDAMRTNTTQIVIASSIFNMGVNVPLIRCIVRLDGGLSQIASLQIPGRGMRWKAHRNMLNLIDFEDTMSEYFARHSKARVQVYTEEQYDIRRVADVDDIPFESLPDIDVAASASAAYAGAAP